MYELFYNLDSRPFQLSPNPEFFFNSRGHKRALSYLRYGLSRGEGFIIITGGIGAGKTTLASTLISELNPREVVAGQLVSTSLGSTGVLGMFCNVFGLPYTEKTTKPVLLKTIEDFLRKTAEEGRRVLLLVDEAQNLPTKSIEELRMLSNFMANNMPLIQTFLLGQEEFRETITARGMEQLRQRVIASYHLTALERDEVYDYVKHRLELAGWDEEEFLFTEQACFEIHEFTGGVPRKINVLCDRLMLFGSLEETMMLGVDEVRTVVNELASEPTALQNQMAYNP